MAKKIDSGIMHNVKAFVAEVKKHYDVDRVYVFGSYAKGVAKEHSDIDVAVVLREEEKFEDMVNMMKMTHKIDWRLEPHPMHVSDFDGVCTPLAYEVKTTGVLVA